MNSDLLKANVKLGKSECVKIAKTGAMALLLGIAYKTMDVYGRQKVCREELSPETESLQDCPQLFTLLSRLQAHRSVNEELFVKCVDNADRLMKIKMTLIESGHHFDAWMAAFLYGMLAIESLDEFMKCGEQAELEPLAGLQLNKLYKDTYNCLMEQLLDVRRLCKVL